MKRLLPSTPYEVQQDPETFLLWHTPQWMGSVHVLAALMKGIP